MHELIKVKESSIGGEQVNSIDARQLHEFLGSRKDFSNWVKAKVVNNVFFTEGQDYILLTRSGEQTGSGGHNRKDYALTMDTAKKVSMAEQTEAGNKARDYFLECEKVAKGGLAPAVGSKREVFELELIGYEHAARILDISQNSLLDGVHTVYENNGVSPAALPQYTEKVRVVCSAKDLLKKNNCGGMSTIGFNKLLIRIGYLETKTRLGSKDVIKPYKSITEKGLKYGQNDAFRGSSTQTQPHWFEDTFMELYALATAQ